MKKSINFIIAKSLGLYINFLSFVFPKKAIKLAYKFFSEPREGRLKKPFIPTLLKEASQEFLTLDSYLFPVYVWKGNETKILLVHGWESNAARWESFFPYLRKSGSTIIALDGPAHGLANGKEFSVPIYAQFLNVVVQKFKPNYLIGHSIGGSACLYFQANYTNDSIKKMILLGAPSDLEILLKNYAAILSLNKRVIQLFENFYWEHFKIKVKEFSGLQLGSKLTIPGLIAHDSEDNIVSIIEGKKIAKGWTNAQFIETKGLGHSMHDDELYQKIYNYLFNSFNS